MLTPQQQADARRFMGYPMVGDTSPDDRSDLAYAQVTSGRYQTLAHRLPLAEATKIDRVRQGYSEDEPLLRSGELRDSIQSEVVGLAAIVGTKSETGLWQEIGTDRIPPRPFIGPAYLRKIDPLMEAIGQTISRSFDA